MRRWIKLILTPAVLWAAIVGVVAFGTGLAADYGLFLLSEASGEVAEARGKIQPIIDPSPKTSRAAVAAIGRLRTIRILYQSESAEDLFARAIGYLDALQVQLAAKEDAEKKRKLQLAKEAEARRGNDLAAAETARRAAELQEKAAGEAARKAIATERSLFRANQSFRF